MVCDNYIDLEFSNVKTFASGVQTIRVYVLGVLPTAKAEGDNMKRAGGELCKNKQFRWYLKVETMPYRVLDSADPSCCEALCQDFGDYLKLSRLVKDFTYMRIGAAVLERKQENNLQALISTATDSHIKLPLRVVVEGGGVPELSPDWSSGIENLSFTLIEALPNTSGL